MILRSMLRDSVCWSLAELGYLEIVDYVVEQPSLSTRYDIISDLNAKKERRIAILPFENVPARCTIYIVVSYIYSLTTSI